MSRKRYGRGALPWLRRQLDVRPWPLWIVLTGHVLGLGIALARMSRHPAVSGIARVYISIVPSE